MKPYIKWISASELMERWGTTERLSIISAVEIDDLTAYEKGSFDSNHPPWIKKTAEWKSSCFGSETRLIEPESFKSVDFDYVVFRIEDIEQYEREHGGAPLSGKERSELGRLRKEKVKWDSSIKSAVELGIFLSDFCSKNVGRYREKITKAELLSEYEQSYPNSPITAFNKIWEAVPKSFKQIDEKAK